jgi:transcriptional regulator with XRE-family HTH domain
LTGEEFRDIRYRLGLSASEWGRALGYSGSHNSLRTVISRYERGRRVIPTRTVRLAFMYGKHGVPAMGTGERERGEGK